MKILIVLTSHDQLGNTGKKTGFWLEEFTTPYYILKDAGMEIILSSPKGGKPPIDPISDRPENLTLSTKRFHQDSTAQSNLPTPNNWLRFPRATSTRSFIQVGTGRCGTCPITQPLSR